MDTQGTFKIFIPAMTITLLVCGGIYLYAQRDLNQFIDSLGEPPAVSQPTITQDRTPERPTPLNAPRAIYIQNR